MSDSWILVEGLRDAYPGTVPLAGERPHQRTGRAVPAVKSLGKLDGVTVVRLAFRDGDVMAEHSAAWPILIMGQVGRVEVTVGEAGENSEAGEDNGNTVALLPGQALNIGAGIVHSLTATEASTVTLLVLHGEVDGTVSVPGV